MSQRLSSAAAGLGLIAVILSSGGCIALAKTETGQVPDWSAVAELQEGASLDEVLKVCGVPIQTLDQPDGLLLMYRERYYDFKRVGFQPGIAVRFIDLTGVVSSALQNLNLVFEWGKVDERRLVVLFDREDRMTAVSYQGREDEP